MTDPINITIRPRIRVRERGSAPRIVVRERGAAPRIVVAPSLLTGQAYRLAERAGIEYLSALAIVEARASALARPGR